MSAASPKFEPVGEVRTDSRKRIRLARFVEPDTLYAVEKDTTGAIRLTPMALLPRKDLEELLGEPDQ